MVGAVAGSPGTIPTNWGQLLIGGLTRTVVGTGTENGLSYVDIRYNGTATGAGIVIGFETVTGIAAANGQTWTGSFYAKTIASSPNAFRSIIVEYTSFGGYVTENTLNISVSSTLNRFTHTYTLAGGVTTARVVNGVLAVLTIGTAYDFTIRIAAPQMELGATASTFIPTTTAAVTRLADAVSLNPQTLLGATTGSWFIEIEDITFEAVTTTVPTNYIGDNASNLLGYEARGATNKLIHFVKEESNVVTTLYSFTPTQKHKACFVWSGTSLKLFVDGVKRYDDGSFVQPTNWDEFKFNNAPREAQQTLNQTLLFPTALTDDQAIELTA
jgi:hypothetical protein